MTRLTTIVLSGALLLGACVHRPYYRDLIAGADDAKELRFRLADGEGTPLVKVPIRVNAGRDRATAVTDHNGEFTLPVRKSLNEPYTVVEVLFPNPVSRYTIARLDAEQPSEQQPVPEARQDVPQQEVKAQQTPPSEQAPETAADALPPEAQPADAGS